jgi:hypothetical protein
MDLVVLAFGAVFLPATAFADFLTTFFTEAFLIGAAFFATIFLTAFAFTIFFGAAFFGDTFFLLGIFFFVAAIFPHHKEFYLQYQLDTFKDMIASSISMTCKTKIPSSTIRDEGIPPRYHPAYVQDTNVTLSR